MQAFDEAYEKLNGAQKRAVDTIEGPVMVVAGPGTGKTQVLTLRIAQILRKTDTEPRNILALTFTEAAAASIRRRLAEVVGSAAYAVRIATFHGFCNEIIARYPEEFPRIIGARPATEVERIRLIERAIEVSDLTLLKPFGDPLYYLSAAAKAMDELKREDVSCTAFEEVLARERAALEARPDLRHEKGPHVGKVRGEHQKTLKRIEKNIELARVYRAYEAGLEEERLFDFADMLVEVLRALRSNADLLLALQEEYHYLLVDEHQDTNNAQNRIVELLMGFHDRPNIFVVGDEKQAIFRFQGASLENFYYFAKRYPGAELVALTDNYRSTQRILDSAQSLLPSREPLVARARSEAHPIRIFELSDRDAEIYALSREVEERLRRGVEPSEIAVLYRDNRDAFPVARVFAKRGIPFRIESNEDLLDDPTIRKLLILLRLADRPGDDELLARALHIDFLGVDPIDTYRLLASSMRLHVPISRLIRSPGEAGVSEAGTASLARFAGMVEAAARRAKNENLLEAFESLVRETGYLAEIIARPDPARELNALHALFDEARSVAERGVRATLGDFVRHLDTVEERNLLIARAAPVAARGAVRLMTAHRAKGLEFDCVCIVDARDGKWGGRKDRETLRIIPAVFSLTGDLPIEERDDDDERRLFYVALTRAKREALIFYAARGGDGRELLPSRFVRELNEELTERAPVAEHEAEWKERRALHFEAPKGGGGGLRDGELVRALFAERGLSVTALNNFLRCPWRYFYTNLLRIPQAKSRHQIYGTALHAALKDYWNELAATAPEGRIPDRDAMTSRVAYHLGRESLDEEERATLIERGTAALGGYYDAYHDSWGGRSVAEFSIGGVLLEPGIRLTGILDKLEFFGALNDVVVVDYKTGKPKSRRQIEGETADSEGDIKRQVIFYNLLLNLYEEGRKYRMVAGRVDFVEPDARGAYRREEFVIEPREVEELAELVKDVARQITTLAFWDEGCGESDCEFCALRKVMR